MCVLSTEMWTSSGRTASRGSAEACSRSQASCTCLGLYASPPLQLPVASWQIDTSFATIFQRSVCSGVRQARHRHARLELCRLGRFDRNPRQLKVSQEEDEKMWENHWAWMITPFGKKSGATMRKREYFDTFAQFCCGGSAG